MFWRLLTGIAKMLSLQAIRGTFHRLMYVLKETRLRKTILLFLMSLMAVSGIAQKRKLERLPYIDQRRIHFGFSVGLHTQDLGFTHTGYTTEAGETWYAEVPSFSPGFNVGLVSDLYLCKYLNLRFCPTMYFGNKTVEFREDHTDERRTVDLRSNYIMIPIDIKYSAKRLNNYCPYITAGVAGAFDISKKKNELLKLKTYDTYLQVGLGCDIYLPFFKLIPELKFCFGLGDILQHKRPDLRDPLDYKYTQAIKRASSNMVVLTFYFE